MSIARMFAAAAIATMALSGAALAQDKGGTNSEEMMKKEEMAKDAAMKKDEMAKEEMMKKEEMAKDAAMEKEEMAKDAMAKDKMKK